MTAQIHAVVSRTEWLESRKALLTKEKELTRRTDELARERREMPWVIIDKPYVFEGPNGKETLADLFGGKSQLAVYHFMMGPDWEEGCASCSFLADHFDGMVVHLAHRDVSLVVISRAPYEQIAAFQKRMGWKFKWVSSFGNDFNFDFHVSFTKDDIAKGNGFYNFEPGGFPIEEAPGISVFYKDEMGNVFHTYSSYARGGEVLLGTYSLLNLVPKGRDEEDLVFSMSWLRHHDKYDDNYVLDKAATYAPPKTIGSCCGGHS